MNRSTVTALTLLRSHLAKSPLLSFPPPDDGEWEEIFLFAKGQKLEAMLFQAAADSGLSHTIPFQLKTAWQHTALATMAHYYHMESFTVELNQKMSRAGLEPILLKGIGLNRLYPIKALRPLSDADFYVSDRAQFASAEKLLARSGFRPIMETPDSPGHHRGYLRIRPEDPLPQLVELHRQLVDSFGVPELDQAVDSFSRSLERTAFFESGELFFTLPPTENLVYLTLHALAHFETSGFGLKVLCDFTVMIRSFFNEIRWQELEEWCQELGIGCFFHGLTLLCIQYLGLEEALCPWVSFESEEERASLENTAQLLMEDILAAGEFGQGDSSRMMHIARQKAQQKRGLIRYASILKEETGKRFPCLRRHPYLLPVLAVPVVCRYLRNNKKRRGVTVRQTVKTNDRRLAIANGFRLFR